MIKILFVCHGNICRSPMAEMILKDMVEKAGIADKFEIASAATSTEELGNPVYPPARAELTRRGIKCERRSARQIEKRDYSDFDLLIGMDGANVRNMNRLLGGDPDGKIHKLMEYAGSAKDVADPWYSGRFDAAYYDIHAGCQGLFDLLVEKS